MKITVISDIHIDSKNPASRSDDDFANTVFDKLRQVHTIAKERNHRAITIAGDIFHRVSVPNSFVARVLEFFDSFDLPVYSISGNHDLFHSNINSLNKSPIYLLYKSGVVKDLTTDKAKQFFSDSGVNLEAKHFQYDMEIPEPEGSPSILIGHQYIEDVYGEERELIDVSESEFDFTIMGHNHTPTVENLDNTTAIVPGALSRLTSLEEDMNRDIYTWEIDFEAMEYERIQLDIEPVDEVFNQQALEEKANQKDIKDFVNSLDESESGQDFGNVSELLDSYDIDSDVKSKCEYYLREHGIIE